MALAPSLQGPTVAVERENQLLSGWDIPQLCLSQRCLEKKPCLGGLGEAAELRGLPGSPQCLADSYK